MDLLSFVEKTDKKFTDRIFVVHRKRTGNGHGTIVYKAYLWERGIGWQKMPSKERIFGVPFNASVMYYTYVDPKTLLIIAEDIKEEIAACK